MINADANRITELEHDNKRLRRLLDQQDAPGELRHRLRSTLALLRAIIRRSAETERDLPGYVAQLEDRLDAIVRAQAFADQHGAVDLRTLLAEELFQYNISEGEQLVLSGPDLPVQPRVGQVLALAFHELAVNAVEHGALGAEKGRIAVAWAVADQATDTLLELTWTEFGQVLDAQPGGSRPNRSGFGMEVLTRMLPYELRGEASIAYEPGILRWTIRIPIPKQERQPAGS